MNRAICVNLVPVEDIEFPSFARAVDDLRDVIQGHCHGLVARCDKSMEIHIWGQYDLDLRAFLKLLMEVISADFRSSVLEVIGIVNNVGYDFYFHENEPSDLEWENWQQPKRFYL